MLKVQAGRSVLRYLGGVSGPVDQESQTLVMGQDLPDYDTAIADPQYRYFSLPSRHTLIYYFYLIVMLLNANILLCGNKFKIFFLHLGL